MWWGEVSESDVRHSSYLYLQVTERHRLWLLRNVLTQILAVLLVLLYHSHHKVSNACRYGYLQTRSVHLHWILSLNSAHVMTFNMNISTHVCVFRSEIFYSWVWPSFLSVTLATHLLDYLQLFQYDNPSYKNQVVINWNCCLISCLFTTVQKAILSLTSLLFFSL